MINIGDINETETKRMSTALIATIIVISLFAGGFIGYSISYLTVLKKINTLQNELLNPLIYQNITYISGGNISLPDVYKQAMQSVVVVQGQVAGGRVQGSGFVYNYTGQMMVVTNYHVVQGAKNISITFIDGNAYSAKVLGSDPYSDLAVISTTNAPMSELKPLQIVSSSSLEVGDTVIAIGGPYGLAGSMTTGIVSALNRTITEDISGYPIADIIQMSTPINPGNSGGPLLNILGRVVGITTAIVSNSQGLGFAISSNTILREISALFSGESFPHSLLGISGIDMNYYIAHAMSISYTYGLLVETSNNTSIQGSPYYPQNPRNIDGQDVYVGGDIIIAINQTRIRNMDDLSTYLTYTLPGQTVNVTVVRNNTPTSLGIQLLARQTPTSQ